MQVTLPLKNKAKIKTYQYVIVENSEKSIKGKADVQERWTDMKATLGLQSNCLIFIAREPEGLVPIDEKEADPNQLGRKINGDVIYYPNVKYREEEQLFVFTLLSYKTIYGQ